LFAPLCARTSRGQAGRIVGRSHSAQHTNWPARTTNYPSGCRKVLDNARGERGQILSGGRAKRLGDRRALIHDPPVADDTRRKPPAPFDHESKHHPAALASIAARPHDLIVHPPPLFCAPRPMRLVSTGAWCRSVRTKLYSAAACPLQASLWSSRRGSTSEPSHRTVGSRRSNARPRQSTRRRPALIDTIPEADDGAQAFGWFSG